MTRHETWARAFAAASLLSLTCCADATGAEADATATTDPGEPCWTSTRTGFPDMSRVWSDGQQLVVVGRAGLSAFDGQDWVFFDDERLNTARQVVAHSFDEAWVVTNDVIYRWDGATIHSTLANADDGAVAIDPAGELWALAQICSSCPASVWRWQDEGWGQEESTGISAGRALAAGADGELWAAGAEGWVSHRVGEVWTQEQLDPALEPELFGRGPDGALWLVGHNASQLRILHRGIDDPTWSEGAITGASYVPSMVTGAGELLVHRVDDDYVGELWRWTGVGEPELLLSLGFGSEGIGGTPQQLHAVVDPHRVLELDATASEPTPELLFAPTQARPRPGQGATVDHVLEFDQALRRWDGERWTELVEPLSGISESSPRFEAVWAESVERSWALVLQALPVSETSLHRVSNTEGLVEASRPWPEGTFMIGLWGRGDELWAIGQRENLGVAWSSSAGADWVERLSTDDGLDSLVTISGDDERVWALSSGGQVIEWSGEGWTSLGESLATGDIIEPTLLPVGDELLCIYSLSDGADFPSVIQYAKRWDGTQWRETSLPVATVQDASSDALGRAWLVSDDDSPQVWFHDEGGAAHVGWSEVELDGVELGASVSLHATGDGLVVHGSRETATFRWSCG